jgi:hypothetical protein
MLQGIKADQVIIFHPALSRQGRGKMGGMSKVTQHTEEKRSSRKKDLKRSQSLKG